MQIIKQNNIISVDAMSNEDSLYPKENSISKQPMQISKSSSTSSKIIFTCGSLTNLALFNVSAVTGKLEIIDNNVATFFQGTDIAVTGSNTVGSSTTDLSFLADGDKFIMIGFDAAGSNGEFTVSGTPTSTSLTTVETLTTESAGNTISIMRFNDSDKAVNLDINFAYCKTWTDYFSGNSIFIDSFYNQTDDIFSSCTIQLTITGILPSIGLVYAGLARNYGRSQYGTSKNIDDNSIFRKSANGSLNQVSRPVNIGATVQVSCSRAESVALENLFKYQNSEYKVFNIKQDNSDGLQSQLLIYGKIEKKPRTTWQKPDRFGYTVEITSIGGYES